VLDIIQNAREIEVEIHVLGYLIFTKDKDTERVERNDPKDMLQKHKWPVKAQQSFPGQLFASSIPIQWPVYVIIVPFRSSLILCNENKAV